MNLLIKILVFIRNLNKKLTLSIFLDFIIIDFYIIFMGCKFGGKYDKIR